MFLYAFTISLLVLFIGISFFLFYVMSSFITSFMIIVGSITILIELCIYWPLACVLISCI